MNQDEHVSMARELMRRADREWHHGGDEMIAAELLWGALAHCLVTVSLNEDVAHDSHRAFRLGLLAGATNLSAVLLVSLFRVFFGGPFSPSSWALLAFFLVSTITSAVLARRLVVRPSRG